MAYFVFAFDSTHDALFAERLLASLKPCVMPTPRAISASCGIALRIEAALSGAALELMRRKGHGAWYLYKVADESASASAELVEKAALHSNADRI